jgi:hypothetical protein
MIRSLILPLLLVSALVAGMLIVMPAEAVQAQVDICSGAGGELDGSGKCVDPSGEPGIFSSDDGESSIFQRVANVMTFIVGAVSVLMLIIGGLRYVLSAGDANATAAAKNTIIYAIVGIVVAFMAFAAVSFVVTQLEA